MLDTIESMYENKKREKLPNCLYRALEFSLDHLKFFGGRLYVFHSDPILTEPKDKTYLSYSLSNKL